MKIVRTRPRGIWRRVRPAWYGVARDLHPRDARVFRFKAACLRSGYPRQRFAPGLALRVEGRRALCRRRRGCGGICTGWAGEDGGQEARDGDDAERSRRSSVRWAAEPHWCSSKRDYFDCSLTLYLCTQSVVLLVATHGRRTVRWMHISSASRLFDRDHPGRRCIILRPQPIR